MNAPTDTSPFSTDQLTEIRSNFEHTGSEKIYLNHAAISPLSKRVKQRIHEHLERRSSGTIGTFPQDVMAVETSRKYVMNMINAESEDRIAFVANTSHALNLVARGLHWENGDRILTNDLEFPSNVYPYLNLEARGVATDFIAHQDGCITPEQVEKHISEQTKMVAISAVQFLSGYRPDLAKIGEVCRQYGTWFVVDGIQAIGATEVDVQAMKIHALASGGQKWLMSPMGTGFLYLAKELQDLITDHDFGWLSVEEPWQLYNHDQPLDETARRFETGTANMMGMHGMQATLEFMHEVGMQQMYEHIYYLTGQLIAMGDEKLGLDLFTSREPHRRAGIISYKLPEGIESEAMMTTLKQNNLTVAIREGMLRISPHFYNTVDELEQAVDMVAGVLKTMKAEL